MFDTPINLETVLNDEISQSNDKFVTLPTDKIKSNPQVRKKFTKIKELSELLLEHGQLQSIIISPPDENGIHIILDGERRWRACILANIDTIKCEIKESEEKDPILQLIANIAKEDLTYFEIGDRLKVIQNQFEYNLKELAKSVGQSESWVSRHLKIANTDDAFKKLCSDNNVNSVSMADNLEKIYRKKPKIAKKLAENKADRAALEKQIKKINNGINTRVRKPSKANLTISLGLVDSDGSLTPVSIISYNSAKDNDGNTLDVSLSDLRVIEVK